MNLTDRYTLGSHLLVACSRGDVGAIRAALEQLSVTSDLGEKAWVCAALSGSDEAFNYITSRGANPPDDYTCEVIAKSPRLAGEALRRMSRSPNVEIRCGVASNTNSPPDVLEALVHDPNDGVVAGACRNPSMPPAMLKRLLSVVRATPELMIPAADSRYQPLKHLALNPALPADELEQLSGHPDPRVRAAVAAHSALSEELRARLTVDEDPQVRERLDFVMRRREARRSAAEAGRPCPAPASIPEGDGRPHAGTETYRLESMDEDAREKLAADHATPPAVLRQLATDSWNGVRILVAENPSTEPETLRMLSYYDPEERVLSTLASRLDLPADAIPSLVWRVEQLPYESYGSRSLTEMFIHWRTRWRRLRRKFPLIRHALVVAALLFAAFCIWAQFQGRNTREGALLILTLFTVYICVAIGILWGEKVRRSWVRRNRARHFQRSVGPPPGA